MMSLIASSVLLLLSSPAVEAQDVAERAQPAPTTIAAPDAPRPEIPNGLTRFEFDNWDGPAIPVWAYIPASVDVREAPILIVMHGAKRAPKRYTVDWIEEASKGGFIVIAPEFSRDLFPTSRQYNRGNLFPAKGAALSDENAWTFSAIEPLFDHLVERLESEQTGYTLYGHSAGSQFAHRFLFLKPNARARRYLLANAGWYTFPDRAQDWPYGLRGVPVSEDQLEAALAKDVVVLLGDKDNDRAHESLNRSKGAMRQGPHRFARGQAFFQAGETLAAENGWAFNWSMRTVPDVAHSNGGIAAAAFDLVE